MKRRNKLIASGTVVGLAAAGVVGNFLFNPGERPKDGAERPPAASASPFPNTTESAAMPSRSPNVSASAGSLVCQRILGALIPGGTAGNRQAMFEPQILPADAENAPNQVWVDLTPYKNGQPGETKTFVGDAGATAPFPTDSAKVEMGLRVGRQELTCPPAIASVMPGEDGPGEILNMAPIGPSAPTPSNS